METEESLEQHILNVAQGKVVKKRKIPYLPVLFLICGCAMSASYEYFFKLMGENIANTVLFFGIAFCIYGVCALFSKKYNYFTTSGERLQKYSFGFDIQDYEKIKFLYDKEDFDALFRMSQSQSPGVILDIIGCKEGDFYLSQMTKYVPHRYVAEDYGRLHEGHASEAIQHFLTVQ